MRASRRASSASACARTYADLHAHAQAHARTQVDIHARSRRAHRQASTHASMHARTWEDKLARTHACACASTHACKQMHTRHCKPAPGVQGSFGKRYIIWEERKSKTTNCIVVKLEALLHQLGIARKMYISVTGKAKLVAFLRKHILLITITQCKRAQN